MAFKNFKSKHGGSGPFETFYAAATGGRGLFGRLGMREERDMTNQLINEVQSTEGYEGLAAITESGRGPLTREQHSDFRAGLVQAVVNKQTFDRGYEIFSGEQARLKNAAQTKGDLEQLGVLDSHGLYAQTLMESADPAVRQQGASIMASVLGTQRQYAATNEVEHAQLVAADDAERNQRRQEIQTELNSRIFDPMRQDRANYEAIAAQLTGDGDELAPPALITEVLDYAGAQLRQSDDGNWSFSFGGLGFGDKAVPDMTYSQLRNQLNTAHSGRDKFMSGEASRIGTLAQRQGFGINGTEVSDLMFPLADRVYKAREVETRPLVSPDQSDQAGRDAGNTARQMVGAGGEFAMGLFGISPKFTDDSGALYERVDRGGGRFEWKVVEDAPQPERPRVSAGNPYNAAGQRSGVYVPKFLRRPTNGD